jgi:hypothetical protein
VLALRRIVTGRRGLAVESAPAARAEALTEIDMLAALRATATEDGSALRTEPRGRAGVGAAVGACHAHDCTLWAAPGTGQRRAAPDGVWRSSPVPRRRRPTSIGQASPDRSQGA